MTKSSKKVLCLVLILFLLSVAFFALPGEESAFASTNSALTFSADVPLACGNGYEWYGDTKTLLLYGVDISLDSADPCLTVPDGTTIELVGYNRLSNSSSDCLYGEGTLTVKGSGALACEGNGIGIKTEDTLTVQGGYYVLSSKNGINSAADLQIDSGNFTINASSKSLNVSASFTQNGGSVVCVSGESPSVKCTKYTLNAGYLSTTATSNAFSVGEDGFCNKGGVFRAVNDSSEFSTTKGAITVESGVTILKNNNSAGTVYSTNVTRKNVSATILGDYDNYYVYSKSYVSYDSGSDSGAQVSSLQNAFITVTGDFVGVQGSTSTTPIEVSGANYIESTADKTNLSACSLTGTGTLVVSGNTSSILVELMEDYGCTLDGVHLIALNEGTGAGVATTNGLTISSGEVIASTKGTSGAICGNLTMSGGNVVAVNTGDGVQGAVTVSGGNLTAFSGQTAMNGNVSVTGGSVSGVSLSSTVVAVDGTVSVNNSEATQGKVGLYGDFKAMSGSGSAAYSYVRASDTLSGSFAAVGDGTSNNKILYFGPRPTVTFEDGVPNKDILSSAVATNYAKSDEKYTFTVTAPAVADGFKTVYYIAAWNTQSNGKGTSYDADKFTMEGYTGTVPLYAVWAKVLVKDTSKAYLTLTEAIAYLKTEEKTGDDVKLVLLGQSLTESNVAVSLKNETDYFVLYNSSSDDSACGLKITNGDTVSAQSDVISFKRETSDGDAQVIYWDGSNVKHTDTYVRPDLSTLSLDITLNISVTVSPSVTVSETKWEKYMVEKIVDSQNSATVRYSFSDCSDTDKTASTLQGIFAQTDYNYAESSFTVVGEVNTDGYLSVVGTKKQDGSYYTDFYNFNNATGVSTATGTCKHQEGLDNTAATTITSAHTAHKAYVNQLIAITNGAITLKSTCITIGDVSVTATIDEQMTSKSVVLTLFDTTFTSNVKTGTNVNAWFTNLPDGMSAKIASVNTDKTKVTVNMTGTPTVRYGGSIAVTIPYNSETPYLDDITFPLNAIENTKAEFLSMGTIEIDEASQEITFDGDAKEFDVIFSQSFGDSYGDEPDGTNITVTYKLEGKDVSSPKDAGSYTVIVTIAQDKTNLLNAFTTTIEGGLVITQKAVEIGDFTYTAPTPLTYDGSVKSATVFAKQDGMGSYDVVYYRGETKLSGAPTAVGTYTVKLENIQEGKNYLAGSDITLDTFTVVNATLTVKAGLVGDTECIYDGNAHEIDFNKTKITAVNSQTITVTYRTTAEEEYSSTMPSFTDAGIYTVTCKFSADNHDDYTCTAKVTINQKAYNGTDFTVTPITELTYTGVAQEPVPQIVYSGMTLAKTTDMILTYSDNKNVGTASVSIEFTGNYSGNHSMTFTIKKATLVPSVGTLDGKTYDGTTSATGTISLSGAVNGENPTATATFVWTSEKATTSTVDVSGITLDGSFGDNYELSVTSLSNVTVTSTIAKADITVTTFEQSGSLTYNGSAQTPTVTKTVSSVNAQVISITYSLTQKGSYAADLPTVTNAGDTVYYYHITADNHNDYDGSFTITVAKCTPTVDMFTFTAPTALTYSASGKEATVVTKDGLQGMGSITVEYDYAGTWKTDLPKDVGSYAVRIQVAEGTNYTAKEDVTGSGWSFAITTLSLDEPTVKGTYTYNKNEQKVELEGFDETYMTVTKGNKATDAGSYEVELSLDTNCEWNNEGDGKIAWSIAKFTCAEPTVKGTYTYNATEQTVELDGLESYMTVASGDKYTNAGSYTVTITIDTKNYEWQDEEDGKVDWSIAVRKLDEPTVKGTYTYNKNEQTVELEDFDATYMTVTKGNKATDAGSYEVELSLDTNCEWNNEGDGKIAWSIAKFVCAEPTVKGMYTYNATEQTVELDGLESYMTVASGDKYTNAGSYTVTVTVDTKNYEWQDDEDGQISWTIQQLDISSAVVTLGKALIYNGSEQTQSVTSVVADGVTVIGYTVSDAKNTAAGTYTLKITVGGNFKGTAYEDYTIATKDIAGATVTLGDALTYNGSAQTQTVTAVTIEKLAATFEVTDNINTNAGTYTLTVKGTGNFSGQTTKDYTVSPLSISTAVITLGKTLVYNTTAQKQAIASVTVGALSLNGEDYLVSGEGNTVVGEYTLTLQGKGNYCDEASIGYVIQPCPVSEPTVRGEKYYTGSDITVEWNGFTSYMAIVKGNVGKDVGDYEAEISLNENYTWAAGNDGKVAWKILKASNKITEFSILDWAYGDKASKPSTRADFGSVIVTYSDSKNGNYTSTVPEKCGTYYMKGMVEDTDNYAGATHAAVAFTILHTYGDWQEIVLPNCTETGICAHKDCICCQRHFDENNEIISDIVIPANGHTYLWKENEQKEVQYCGVCLVEFDSFTMEKEQNIVMIEPSTVVSEKQNIEFKNGDTIINNSGKVFYMCVGKKGLLDAVKAGEIPEDAVCVEKGGRFTLSVDEYTYYNLVGEAELDGITYYVLEKSEKLDFFEIFGIVAGSIILLIMALYVVGIFMYRKNLLKGKFFESLFSWLKKEPVPEKIEIEEL